MAVPTIALAIGAAMAGLTLYGIAHSIRREIRRAREENATAGDQPPPFAHPDLAEIDWDARAWADASTFGQEPSAND